MMITLVLLTTLSMTFGHPETGDVGLLTIGAKEKVMFDLNFNKALPEDWKMINAEIVEEVSKPSPDPQGGTTTTTTTVKPAAEEESKEKEKAAEEPPKAEVQADPVKEKILVAKFNSSVPEKIGELQSIVVLESGMRFIFSTLVKAVGYNITVPGYFGAGRLNKPFLEIKLVPVENKVRGVQKSEITIFNFNQYGLSLKENKWTDITYSLDIQLESPAVGNYTLMYRFRGGKKPQEKGTMLKSFKLSCLKLPKDNERIRKEYLASTTTEAPTTVPSTTTEATNTTAAPGPDGKRIFGSKGTEIFILFLIVLLALAFVILAYRHYQIRQKLREYKVNNPNRPNYDNPVFGGSHISAERMNR